MNTLKHFGVLLIVFALSGCTALYEASPTTEEHRNDCIVGVSAFSALMGGIISTPLGAGVGMAAGGALGHHFCAEGEVPASAPELDYYYQDDQDVDRVLDNEDQCPFTPEGVQVDANGCALDGDEDGVPDYLDKCLATPKGNVVDIDGCSLKLLTIEDVHFAFDSYSLNTEAKAILDDAVVKLNVHSASSFMIEGHTDSDGTDDYNMRLSERRASSVMNYLISRGVDASRLTAVGKGENFPIASNDSRQGRADNRRVDVYAR